MSWGARSVCKVCPWKGEADLVLFWRNVSPKVLGVKSCNQRKGGVPTEECLRKFSFHLVLEKLRSRIYFVLQHKTFDLDSNSKVY